MAKPRKPEPKRVKMTTKGKPQRTAEEEAQIAADAANAAAVAANVVIDIAICG